MLILLTAATNARQRLAQPLIIAKRGLNIDAAAAVAAIHGELLHLEAYGATILAGIKAWIMNA
ncbi:MAG: hypothetical protein CO092_05240 [Candidatus Aenigmarchaeota archaeon CG_4_9_14_3_um_filter_37_18]|nr:MAG: hypothetical protein AUK23_01665 [Deltaproteobacteria bacterium CG2_30_43_15]PIV68718.1 MAG: hypothetical protein COS07_03170 [Candidatus Aenigmarchaeota archaeon CG01_land_8_20_14_3_00_37_9]PIY35653.1 MAG: hypothetical protein COZ04_02765 [Candidatus Aenigmarchaeota archaeon CG_4_10_14_3_um_filter_37_21]PJB74092.1 MAG: hypothetical protein CO092_05240 [Candidatus Aenigmarchaeota archaeon CG_4_9_14_3_um_filter_37_18]